MSGKLCLVRGNQHPSILRASFPRDEGEASPAAALTWGTLAHST